MHLARARPADIALKQRVVFGIDRQHGRAFGRGAAHEQAAGADEAFLVGERDHGAAFGRGERRPQTGGAGDRRHHPVRRAATPPPPELPLRRRSRSCCPRARPSVRDAGAGSAIAAKRAPTCFANRGQCRDISISGDGLDAKTSRLPHQQIDRAGCRSIRWRQECSPNASAVVAGVAASAQAACCCSSHHQPIKPCAGEFHPPRATPITSAAKRRRDKPVEAIHHAAMTRNQRCWNPSH